MGHRFTLVRRLNDTSVDHEFWVARTDADLPCVIKRLRPPLTERTDLVQRLQWEAHCLTLLGGHSYSLRCLGQVLTPPTLLLEYASGGSLADRLRTDVAGACLPFVEVQRIAAMLFEAIRHVHSHDLVHRDLKPSNLLFTGAGELRLSDFGVAARIGSPGTLEHWDEDRIGTLGYAAPEQLVNPATSTFPSADVYSVGVVLYELLTGHLPFELLGSEDEDGLRDRIIAGTPVPLRSHGASITPALEQVVLKALEGNPDRRFHSIWEFAREWTAVTD